MSRAHPSLRKRLWSWMLGAVLVASGVQAALAYSTALAEADLLFDHHMQKMAQSLASSRLSRNIQPSQAVAPDRENEDFVAQVWTRSGEPLFQSAAHRRLRPQAAPGFSDVLTLDARTFRVYVMITAEENVQVAQDMAARRDMARALAMRSVLPGLFMAPILMLVLWWVVQRSMAPVARVQQEMALRRVDDLSPVNEEGVPLEVQPLIRELNLLFDRVKRAFEGQQHFVADAAHELRSPLAALKVQVQGLQRATDDEARERAARRLSAGIDRATHLVDQLMMLARQEASVVAGSQAQAVDLAQVALLALTDVLGLAQQRQVDLGVLATQAAQVMAQPDTLRVLVRNLLDNGSKYTPAGGTVDLSVHLQGRDVLLIVEDSGPGIPLAHHERVWDRFYRLPGSQADGSGLGLTIVKAVADAHGATVKLSQSERLGGLRVCVHFPAVA